MVDRPVGTPNKHFQSPAAPLAFTDRPCCPSFNGQSAVAATVNHIDGGLVTWADVSGLSPAEVSLQVIVRQRRNKRIELSSRTLALCSNSKQLFCDESNATAGTGQTAGGGWSSKFPTIEAIDAIDLKFFGFTSSDGMNSSKSASIASMRLTMSIDETPASGSGSDGLTKRESAPFERTPCRRMPIRSIRASSVGRVTGVPYPCRRASCPPYTRLSTRFRERGRPLAEPSQISCNRLRGSGSLLSLSC